jgi:LacI family gluconate utilization system Gnt-I transcriptional repressor
LIQVIRGDEKRHGQEIVLTGYRVVEREST